MSGLPLSPAYLASPEAVRDGHPAPKPERTLWVITRFAYVDDRRQALGFAWGRSSSDAVKAWMLFHNVPMDGLDALPWVGAIPVGVE